MTAWPGGAASLLAGEGWEPLRRYEHQAMGTWNVLLLADPDPSRPAETDRAAQAAFALLDRLEDELSRFRPESAVGLLNALGHPGPVPVGDILFEVLQIARRAFEETGGAFDPTVGPLMDAWGFPRGPARVPPPEEIEELLTRRGMDRLALDAARRTARFERPGMALDLGAVGKGYAVDRMAELLLRRGSPAGAILSGRSSIRLWGAPPGGGSFEVAVAHPRDPGESIRTLAVEAGSISTSAAYEEKFVLGGVEYGHVLDPRTGYPVRNGVRSVTVWTPTAVEGDVLSTALYVLGRAEARTLLDRRPRASALIIEDDPTAWGGLRVTALHQGAPAPVSDSQREARKA